MGVALIFLLMFLIFVIFFISIIVYIVKTLRRAHEITKATERLQKNLNDEKVRWYMKVINKGKIPGSPTIWNTLRAGYQLVRSSGNVDPELKNQLRIIMLSKGVDRI